MLQLTIDDCNMAVENIQPNAFALVVEVPALNRLHSALLKSGSPVQPGDDNHESLIAFREWLTASTFYTKGVTKANLKGTCAWVGLTEEQAREIAFEHWRVDRWMYAIKMAHYEGPIARVLWLRGTRPGRAHLFPSSLDVFGACNEYCFAASSVTATLTMLSG